jgi:hypothetical protein
MKNCPISANFWSKLYKFNPSKVGRGSNTYIRGPTIVFLAPWNLSHQIDSQVRTGDTALVKSWEMRGRTLTKHCRGGWWEEGSSKDDSKQNTLASLVGWSKSHLALMSPSSDEDRNVHNMALVYWVYSKTKT